MTFTKKALLSFVLLSLVLSFTGSVQAAPQCAQVFRTARFEAVPSQATLREIQDLLTQDLRKQSSRLENKILSQGGQTQVQTLVIGAGLHGAIFAMNVGKNNRMKDTLVIESGEVVSKAFGEMAGAFRINSIELEKQSANIFPGSPLKMKDLTKADFASSLGMALLGTGTMYSSAVPLLFNNKAVEIVDLRSLNKNSSHRYLVKTSKGLEILTNKIVFATGLGEPSIPLKDRASRKQIESYIAVSEKDPSTLLPVMTVDSFLRLSVLRDQSHAADLSKELGGKTVAVVGKGDGGKIVIEALLNKGPLQNLKFPGLQVLWLGQEALTPAQYRESTWDRYHTIADNIGREVKTVPGYVEQVQVLPSGKINITYDGGKKATADYVLMATGYKSMIPELLGRSEEVELALFKNKNKVIGSRVLIKGKGGEEIYVTGPAAGKLATPEELASSITQNPVSIAVLGSFTQSLAQKLAPSYGKIRLNSGKNQELLKTPVPSIGRQLPKDSRALGLLAKLELQRSLLEFSFEANEIQIEFSVVQNQALIKVNGVEAPSAKVLAEALARNAELLQVLNRLSLEEGPLRMKIPVENQEFVVTGMELEVR